MKNRMIKLLSIFLSASMLVTSVTSDIVMAVPVSGNEIQIEVDAQPSIDAPDATVEVDNAVPNAVDAAPSEMPVLVDTDGELSADGYTITIDGIDYPVGDMEESVAIDVDMEDITVPVIESSVSIGMDAAAAPNDIYDTILSRGESRALYGRLTAPQKVFYDKLYEAVANFAKSGIDYDVYAASKGRSTYYDTNEQGETIPYYCFEGVLLNDAAAGCGSLTWTDAKIVLFTLRNENPQFYWLDGSYLTSTYGDKRYLVPCCAEEFLTAASRDAIDEAIKTEMENYYIPAITNAGDDVYDQVRAIHDSVVNAIDYKYLADGITPDDSAYAHSIAGVFNRNGTVCEGYAKAFLFLTSYYHIPSEYVCGYTTKGTTSTGAVGYDGGHAWNLVSLDGGNKYYYLDATWDDFNSKRTDAFRTNLYYMWYLIDSDSFGVEHFSNFQDSVNSGYTLGYRYGLPANIGNDNDEKYFTHYNIQFEEDSSSDSIAERLSSYFARTDSDVLWIEAVHSTWVSVRSIVTTSSYNFPDGDWRMYEVSRPICEIENRTYKTSYTVGEMVATPTVSNFVFKDIDGDSVDSSKVSIRTDWYEGDCTNSMLPASAMASKPSAEGTYTAVITASYTTGGLTMVAKKTSIKVEIEGVPKADDPDPAPVPTPQPPKQPVVGQQVKDNSGATLEVNDATNKSVTYKTTPAAGKVTIPNTVVVNGQVYAVTKIDASAFKGNKTVTSITIGSNVKEIGGDAFASCPKLTSVTIPASVEKIGANAFKGCKKLKKITISSMNLTSKTVGKNAFKGIASNAVIKVPKKKLAEYKKLFKKKGLSSKVKIKKK